MAAERPVTRAEVARRAGTSTATVSYVVSNGLRNMLARAALDVLAESASGSPPDGAAARTVTVAHRLVVRRSCGCGDGVP